MPPKRIPSQARIDAASGSHSTIEESDEDLSDDTSDTRARHNNMPRRLVQEKGKLPLTFCKCDGQPVGKHATTFTTESNPAVKTFTPPKIKEWKDITEQQKRPVFDRLQNSFNMDFGTDPDSVKKQTDICMDNRYRDNREKLHNHYKKHSHLPLGGRLQKRPKRFYGDEADWAFMSNLFESEKFKKKSDKNLENQAQLPSSNCGGSKSSSKPPLDDIEISKLVCDKVLGKWSGYIPGLDHGAKPSKLTSGDASSHRVTNAELKQELKSVHDELKWTRASLQSAHANIQALKDNMEAHQRMTMQLFEKLAPDALQDLMSQMSPSTLSLLL